MGLKTEAKLATHTLEMSLTHSLEMSTRVCI